MNKRLIIMLLVTCMDALFYANATHGVAVMTACPMGVLVSLCRLG